MDINEAAKADNPLCADLRLLMLSSKKQDNYNYGQFCQWFKSNREKEGDI